VALSSICVRVRVGAGRVVRRARRMRSLGVCQLRNHKKKKRKNMK
jgi:hypothetical protein